MMPSLRELVEILPAPRGKSPGTAAVIGLLAGGIGLAVYTRNVIDLFLTLGLVFLSAAVFGDAAITTAAYLVAPVYGYYRVHLANLLAQEPGREPRVPMAA